MSSSIPQNGIAALINASHNKSPHNNVRYEKSNISSSVPQNGIAALINANHNTPPHNNVRYEKSNISSSIPQNGIAALINANHNTPPPTETTTSIFGEDGFTFGDIIDIVNPLQHIPIISNLYRKITGDTIAPAMEIAGSALFGGPLGAAISMATIAFQSYTQEKTETTDPDSPYLDNESKVIAYDNVSKTPPIAISNNDYSTISDANSDEDSIHTNIPGITSNSWNLNSGSKSRQSNTDAILNTISDKRTYQPTDGIANMIYKNIETYTDDITSTKSPEKSIDIIIGSTADAG